MKLKIEKSFLKGKIEAIASKSYAHRALICAALSCDKTEIVCNSMSDDILATVQCLRALGADVKISEDIFYVTPIVNVNENAVLDCKESGSTLRFMLPIVCALGVRAIIKVSKRLWERPIDVLLQSLRENGSIIERAEGNRFLVSGKLKGGKIEIDADVSSQFISGLLLALPVVDGNSCVIMKNKVFSRPYIDITLDVVKDFGAKIKSCENEFEVEGGVPYQSQHNIRVEGDWSNAAFWLAMSLCENSKLAVAGLNLKSVQGDMAILNILTSFGAKISSCNEELTITGGKLAALTIDASDIPDLVPILAVIACMADGDTVFQNVERLRFKESDRLSSISEMINNIGGDAQIMHNKLIVKGNAKITGGIVNAYNDHRIAMAAAVAGVIWGGVTLSCAESVSKSYPDFFEQLATVGGKITETEV